MHEKGIWWSFGDWCWKAFHGLEWTYHHITPNKVFIVILFLCFFWWIGWQNKYNQKALKEGSYK